MGRKMTHHFFNHSRVFVMPYFLSIFCFLFFSNPCFSAIESEQINESIVRVINRHSGLITTGTGFVINSQRNYIVTNYHVISKTGYLSVLPAKETTEKRAILKYSSEEEDLAILEIKNLNKPALKLSNYFEQGMAIRVIGFPGTADDIDEQSINNFSSPSHTRGELQDFRKTTQHPISQKELPILQMNVESRGGNSGGPVINNCGEVVGILTLGYPDDKNYSLALRVDLLSNFLTIKRISFEESSLECSDKTLPPVIKNDPQPRLIIGLILLGIFLGVFRKEVLAFLGVVFTIVIWGGIIIFIIAIITSPPHQPPNQPVIHPQQEQQQVLKTITDYYQALNTHEIDTAFSLRKETNYEQLKRQINRIEWIKLKDDPEVLYLNPEGQAIVFIFAEGKANKSSVACWRGKITLEKINNDWKIADLNNVKKYPCNN